MIKSFSYKPLENFVNDNIFLRDLALFWNNEFNSTKLIFEIVLLNETNVVFQISKSLREFNLSGWPPAFEVSQPWATVFKL